MFRAMLLTQWKWTRVLILPLAIAAFAIPVFSVQVFGDVSQSRWQLSSMLGAMQALGMLYMVLSFLLGIMVSAAAWSADLKSKHVYALSLPITRWHYLLLRYAAGAVLLLIPAVVLWIGALLATSTAEIPNGLHAYPTALAARFLLASFLLYSVMFALSSLPPKISAMVGAFIGAIVLTVLAVDQLRGDTAIMTSIFNWAIRWPGFLEVFAGRWMLIDV